MRKRTVPIAQERRAKETMLAGSAQRAEKRDKEAERITMLREAKAHSNQVKRFMAHSELEDAREIAKATGTQVVQRDRRKFFDQGSIGYDYKEVNRRPEIGGAYGNIALNVEKHPDGGYVNTYR